MILLSLLLFISRGILAEEMSFEKVKLKINNVAFNAQVADSNEKREHGLMFIKNMPANDGMIFVFEEERMQGFWMKNTLIPLSIGFFNDQGVLVDVQEMKPAASLMDKNPPTYQSSAPASLALEMNAGWFKKNHLSIGAKISLVGGSKSALLKQKVQSSARQTSSENHSKSP
jgi:uncharacterized protein